VQQSCYYRQPGLVLARSAFHHSMNYRSVVLFGKAAVVEDDADKVAALRALTEHLIPTQRHFFGDNVAVPEVAFPFGEPVPLYFSSMRFSPFTVPSNTCSNPLRRSDLKWTALPFTVPSTEYFSSWPFLLGLSMLISPANFSLSRLEIRKFQL
jgi:hypothetical protein